MLFDLPNSASSSSPTSKSPPCPNSPPKPPPIDSTSTSTPAAAPTRKRLGLTSGLEKSSTKKLTLKAKPRTSLPPDTTAWLTTSLLTLTRAIRAIQSRPPIPTPESFQVLYTLSEGLISSPTFSLELYSKIKLEIERNCVEVRRELGKEGGEGEAWLEGVEREWVGFEREVRLVRSVVLRGDREWVRNGGKGVWELGEECWRVGVVEDEMVGGRIRDGLLGMVGRERAGETVSRPLIRSLIVHLKSLSESTFSHLFSTPFLTTTRLFYSKEGTLLSTSLSSSAYLKKIEQRLQEEEERCEQVLGGELRGSVGRVVLEELVGEGRMEGVVERDLPEMIREDRREDLRSLYTLLSLVGNLIVLKTGLLSYLKEAGLTIVSNPLTDEKMVPSLIDFRKKSLSIVNDAFQGDQAFLGAVQQAFEFFVNKREDRPAEMMAKYLDLKLRAGNKGMDDEDLEETLKEVLFLFRFTQGKDIFEAFYKRDLAKRLLLNKSASFDAERSMLLKLKDECGPGFTQKLEIMFKDMELSSDVMRAYNQFRSLNEIKPPFDLQVSVLSTGNWPSYTTPVLLLPTSLSTALEKFKSFYISKHSGRTLTWAHELDYCSLVARFPRSKRDKELNVSLLQGLVLLLFNESGEGKVAFEELKAGTGIETVELKRTLQSLACGKVRVLVKHPKGRDVNESDSFSFNSEFKDDHVKIKINQIQQKETAEENKSTTDRVFTDRASHLQLAIVRIMKARKTLKYSELVMEVITQIGSRFKVETSEIKKSIGSLIERDYLRRAEDQQNVFEYLA